MKATGATVMKPVEPDEIRSLGANARLAELVVHLSDCTPAAAVEAVHVAARDEPLASHDDRLAVVAAALVSVRRWGIDLRDGGRKRA